MDTPDRTPARDSAPRRSWSASGSFATGFALVLIGVMFLAERTFGFGIANGWAIFVAIPGAVALFEAYRVYERNGRRLDREVVRTATVGAVPLAIAAIFLFRIDWGVVWPVFLILAGIGVWTGAWRTDRS